MIGAPAESAPHFTSDRRLKFALPLELEDKRILSSITLARVQANLGLDRAQSLPRSGPRATYALICLYKGFVKTFYGGGLKGSVQHWLGVYPREFEIPTFFVAVD